MRVSAWPGLVGTVPCHGICSRCAWGCSENCIVVAYSSHRTYYRQQKNAHNFLWYKMHADIERYINVSVGAADGYAYNRVHNA